MHFSNKLTQSVLSEPGRFHNGNQSNAASASEGDEALVSSNDVVAVQTRVRGGRTGKAQGICTCGRGCCRKGPEQSAPHTKTRWSCRRAAGTWPAAHARVTDTEKKWTTAIKLWGANCEKMRMITTWVTSLSLARRANIVINACHLLSVTLTPFVTRLVRAYTAEAQ